MCNTCKSLSSEELLGNELQAQTIEHYSRFSLYVSICLHFPRINPSLEADTKKQTHYIPYRNIVTAESAKHRVRLLWLSLHIVPCFSRGHHKLVLGKNI